VPPTAPAPTTIHRRVDIRTTVPSHAMDETEARSVLGVPAAATRSDIRTAFRRALRAAHPDVRGGSAEATRRIVAAYEVLRDPSPSPSPSTPPSPPSVPAVSVVVDGDTVAADLPAGDLFAMLLDVGHRIGDVGFVDRQNGLLEVIVTFEGYGACSVVLTLQGRAVGLTEAFCTVEPLAGGPAPPVEAVAELLGSGLRSLPT
jgi:hypothetical protein